MRTFSRVICILFTNTVLIYFLSLGSFLIGSAIAGADPRESGFLMISPLAMVIFGLVFVAIYGAIFNGIFLNAFWSKVIWSTKRIGTLSLAIGGGVALISFALTYGPELETRIKRGATYEPFLIILVATSIFALANFLTLLLSKRIFYVDSNNGDP